MSSEQDKREMEMVSIGFDRVLKAHDKAVSRSMSTASPLISNRVFGLICGVARSLQKRHLELKKERDGNPHRGDDAAVLALLNLYGQLDPDPAFGDDELYPYALISSVLVKMIVDRGFTLLKKGPDGSFKSDPRLMQRCALIDKLSKALYLQHRAIYYQQQSEKLEELGYDNADQLKRHLQNLFNSVTDEGSTYDARMRRAKALYNEIDSGRVVVRRGRTSIGAQLVVPEELRHRWSSLFKNTAGSGLLSLLSVPKHGDPLEYPDALLLILEQPHVRGGDALVVRPEWQKLLVGDVISAIRDRCPVMLSMIEKPVDWVYADEPGNENHSGGYQSSALRSMTPLVRFGDGLNLAVPSELAIQFLNKIQSVEWRVDETMHEVIDFIVHHWGADYDGIRVAAPYTAEEVKRGEGRALELPEVRVRSELREQATPALERLAAAKKDPTIHLSDEEREIIDRWNNNNIRLSEIYRSLANRDQQVQGFVSYKSAAERSRGYDKIYFPHSYDYRGRVYPIPVGSAQGSNYSRFALEFANGYRLDQVGERAALTAIGTAAISSKCSLDERYQWALDNLWLIREAGEAPASYRALEVAKDFDEPLQWLQLAIAWVKHEAGGLWHTPVYSDATCSGYQITSALLGNKVGMKTTNVLPGEGNGPEDVYSLSVQWMIDFLLERQKTDPRKFRNEKKLPDEDRMLLLENIADYKDNTYTTSKLGRQLGKAIARTAIYGSSGGTQKDDVSTELEKAGVSFDQFPFPLRSLFVKLFNRGVVELVGDTRQFQRELKAQAKEILLRNVPDDIEQRLKECTDDKSAAKANSRDLSKKKLAGLLEVGRILNNEAERVMFVTPDGSVVDFTGYVVSTEKLQSGLHGKPSVSVTHVDAWDPQKILQAVPPGVVHSIDAAILKIGFADCPYDVSMIHDSVGVHPNHSDDAKARYREGFIVATDYDPMKALVGQGDLEAVIEKGQLRGNQSWRKSIRESDYLIN